MKEPTDHRPAVVQDGRRYTFDAPAETIRLNINPELAETPNGTPLAGEIYIGPDPHPSAPDIARFDALFLDADGQLWEAAFFRHSPDGDGSLVYRPTTPAEAAQFLTENNALLRAVFGAPPQKPRRSPTIAPDAQRVRRHPEEPRRALTRSKGR